MMAPFTPFLADHLYLKLTKESAKESVHLEDFPVSKSEKINKNLEQGVQVLEEILLLGRNLRDQLKTKVKIPLLELQVIHRTKEILENLKPLENYLLNELNVKKVSYRQDEEKFVSLTVKANGATLGPKLGSKMGEASKLIAKLGFNEIQKLAAGESLQLNPDIQLQPEDLKVFRNPIKGEWPVASSSIVTVALDPKIERAQELEGLAREIVNRVQKLRKESRLNLDDRILLEISTKSIALNEAAQSFETYLKDQTLTVKLNAVDKNLTRFSARFRNRWGNHFDWPAKVLISI